MSGDQSLERIKLEAENKRLKNIAKNGGIGKAENEMRKWLGVGSATATQHQRNHIQQDRYDSTLYNELRDASDKIKGLEEQATETFPGLLQDLWATFYKADPTLQEPEKVDRQYQINRPFVERVLEDSATKEARVTTMLDELSAGVAATEAGEKMAEEIKTREELQQAMKQAKAAQNAASRGDEEGADEQMEQAQQKLQAAARDVRRAVRQAVQTGQEKAEELQQTLAGWGLEPDDLKRVPIGERLKLAETITSKGNLKKIADLVGRMRNLARAKQQQKIKKHRDEIHSITVGGELQHTLPVELASLRHPLRRLDFYRRFTEKQLLQYELSRQERLAKGPIVAAIDVSGSMHGARIEWAIASALALADTASRQKRHCHILFFDTEVKQEFRFIPGERDVEKFVQMATVGTGGGTNYEPALTASVAVINSSQHYESADIVMVTDGLCHLPPEFQKYFTSWKEAQKVKGYAVLIGNDPIAELEKWNDKVWKISNLAEAGDEVAGELFEEVY